MTAERQRLEAASANLANSNTTRTPEGGAYRRRDVVMETSSLPVLPSSFASTFDTISFGNESEKVEGVQATIIASETSQGVKRFQPDHPDADADGYVTFPDVDPLEETVNMMSAARSFEANATAFNLAKELARASLRLGDA